MTRYMVNVPLLHIRSRIPAVMPDNAGITGMARQNYAFEGRQVPAEQTSHLGMAQWVQDNNDQFYWGGGLVETGTSTPAATAVAPGIAGYAQLLGLPDKISGTQGKDIVVAILDSGCAAHSALNGKIVAAYDALTGNAAPEVNDDSTIGHGTFVAGLIAAGDTPGAIMTGMAPGVKLIIVKIIDDAEGIDTAHVVNALTWLKEQCPVKPHIINMSFSSPPGVYEPELDQLLRGFAADGTVLIAAGQDNAATFDSSRILYPARHDSVIGVGCVDATAIPAAALSAKIRYLSPNVTFSSTGRFDDYTGGPDYKGSSFSTALVSGLFALALCYLRDAGDDSSPVALVSGLLQDFDPVHFSNSLKLYKNEIPV